VAHVVVVRCLQQLVSEAFLVGLRFHFLGLGQFFLLDLVPEGPQLVFRVADVVVVLVGGGSHH